MRCDVMPQAAGQPVPGGRWADGYSVWGALSAPGVAAAAGRSEVPLNIEANGTVNACHTSEVQAARGGGAFSPTWERRKTFPVWQVNAAIVRGEMKLVVKPTLKYDGWYLSEKLPNPSTALGWLPACAARWLERRHRSSGTTWSRATGRCRPRDGATRSSSST
jgi:hypothetical protein